jgi:hypothetical protein
LVLSKDVAGLPMDYPLTLEVAVFLVGVFLVASHLLAALQPDGARSFVDRFPRSAGWGAGLFTVAVAWFLAAVVYGDLGEMTEWRPKIVVGSVAAYVIMMRWQPEFLAIRAVGMLALLAANPLLQAAFLRPEVSRLALVGLVYAWITLGLFAIGMPYKFRGLASILIRDLRVWRLAVWSGVAYGVVLIGVGVSLVTR